MQLTDILHKDCIAVGLAAANKEDALYHLAQLLKIHGAVGDLPAFLADVTTRELQGPTGIGDGIAIPHGKSDAVIRNCIAIGKLHTPIAWESIDGEPVRVIILFAVQKSSGADAHVRMMARVAGALADEDICTRMREAANRDQLFDALTQSI